ncbi:uncharacterized protein [Narcine bancroftii]|uniref:uncharacterized protein n=1 Tax=Narcine bancroftii TaxID=1343680 RepID=UPI003831316B
MNSLNQEFLFEENPKGSKKGNESEVGANFVSKIWFKNISNNSSTDSNYISENTSRSIETDNQVLTEDNGLRKVNINPFGILAGPDCISSNQLPEPDHFTSALKASFESPLFFKADDTLCDSPGSYHTAESSNVPEHLSDRSDPYEDMEELSTDHNESQKFSERGTSQYFCDLQNESSNEWSNNSEIETSLNGCSLPSQSSCWEGQEQAFVNKHKMELPELNTGRKLNGEIKSIGLHGRNVPDVKSDYKMDVRLTLKTADENNYFEYEITSSPQEERNVHRKDATGNDSILTTNSISCAQGVVNKSTGCDPTEMGSNLKNCKGNGDQQVHLSITAQNSKMAERSNGVQLLKKQEAETSMHGSPGCYLHLDLNESKEMFQTDKFENSLETASHLNGKRTHADCLSETSSFASELDETDYEVRKLTTLAFQSLSCPNDNYLQVYNSGGLTDLSPPLSEERHNATRASAYTEPDCMGTADGCPDSSYRGCALYAGTEESNTILDDSSDKMQFEPVNVAVESRRKGKEIRANRTVPKRQIELGKPQRSELKVFTSIDAVNSCAYVGSRVERGNKKETLECLQFSENVPCVERTRNTNIKNEFGIDKQSQQATSTDGPSQKNKIASCLLTNVISKKMQFEQDLKIDQELNKLTHSSLSPTPIRLKKKDFLLSPMISRVRLGNSVSKSESNNSPDFAQDYLRKNACELNDDDIKENRSVGQMCSHSSVRCEGGLPFDGQTNTIFPDCYTTNVVEDWRESNIDNQNGTSAERTLELSFAKPCPTFNNFCINASRKEKNPSPPRTSVEKYINENSQNTGENLEPDDTIQHDEPPHESKANNIQLSKYAYKNDASRNIFALKSPKMLHNSPKANVERTTSCCIPKSLSLTPDSNTPDLDHTYQKHPVSFKFKPALEQTKVSQCNIKDNISIKNKTKCPIYARDVKKLSHNNDRGTTFCATKPNSDVPDDVYHSSPLPPTLHNVSMIDSSWSRGRKADIDEDSNVTVDKNYLICTESSDTSRLFSSDIKLPIPCKKQENKVTSAKRICSHGFSTDDNGSNVTEPSNFLANVITPQRKQQAVTISNYKESKSPFMNFQVEETQKVNSANLMLNNRITSLVPGESNQHIGFLAGLESLAAQSPSFGSAAEGTKFSLAKNEFNQAIQSELESEEFSINSSSNKDVQMKLNKNELEDIPERIHSREDEKAVHNNMEVQNDLPGGIGYSNEQFDLSNGKGDPQDGCQVKLKSQNILFCNSAGSNKRMELPAWKNDPNNNILENQNECLKVSTFTDKETQTPSRKTKHKKELNFKLENQNEMSENSTMDKEGFELLCGTYQLKRGIRVNLKEQSKLLESSVVHVDKLLLDDAEDQTVLQEGNERKLATDIKESKSVSGKECGFPNEKKCFLNPEERKLSSIANDLEEETGNGVESQNNSDVKFQAMEIKNSNLRTNSITPQNTDKVEKVSTEENIRLIFASESQPRKSHNQILMVPEEEKQSPTKECSNSSWIQTVDEQFSSLKSQVPNEISIPVISTSKYVIPMESSNCSETIKNSTNTSFQETEGQDIHNKLKFSAAIQNAKVNKMLASQIPCFTNLNVKSIISHNPVVKSPKSDLEQQPSLEMKMLAMNKVVTQEDPSIISAPINNLSIPHEEYKPQASSQIQMPAAHSFIYKAGHYSTRPGPPHQNWKTVEPHKQDQQMLPHQCLGEILSFDTSLQHQFYNSRVSNQASTRQSPDLVEKHCRVPQSPHLMDNPQLPRFQYSEAHKKVLIDPETGKHYFVETPMLSPRKMLLDPETGCYVEVIIPQQTYGGFYQTSISPRVLYPNALRPSYIPRMQYSDLISTPLVTYPGPPPGSPEVKMQSHLNSTIPGATEMQNHKKEILKNQLAETNYMESTYSTPLSMSLNPYPTQTATEAISIHSRARAEVKDHSNAFISSQPI